MSAANHRPDDLVQNAFNRLASHLRRQVAGQSVKVDGTIDKQNGPD